MSIPRPVPKLDPDNTPFWTGGKDCKLYIHKCSDCGEYTHPPKGVCRHCRSENIAPEAVPGTGVIDTYTINFQPWAKDMEVPFVIARVKLDDVPGVYLTTNIINCKPDEVNFFDKVRVVFEEQGEIWYPLFEKVS